MGDFLGHCKKAYYDESKCKRFVHITIAVVEFLPIISQITSIFEKLMVMMCEKETGLNNKKSNESFYSHSSIDQQNKKSKISGSSNFLDNLNTWNLKKIKEYHERIASCPNWKTLFTWSHWSAANLMPSMSGLRQIGSYLVTHHGFQNDSLVVCSTLAEFCEKLNLISTTQDDFRKAFVIPTHSSSWGQKQNGIIAKRSEEFPQHIITVVAEKQGTEIHIALLDPMIRSGNQTINANNIGLGLEENIPFTEQELVLSYILSSNLPPENTTLYHSKVLRETSNGCWAFALKDAVAFLKSYSFFKNIKTEDDRFSKKIKEFILKGIETLPLGLMKTAQFSNDQFEIYFSQHPEQDNQDVRKKMAKHQIEGLNQRIGHASVKWIEKLRQLSISSISLN